MIQLARINKKNLLLLKKIVFFFSFCWYFSIISIAQVSITTDNSDPDASAMLDIKSTDKGMLIPRMTTNQRTLISSPATGLLVFDLTTESFWFYNGITWANLTTQTQFTHHESNDLVLPNSAQVDVENDDFVFGSIQLDDTGDPIYDARFFFDKSKGAFRAGQTSGLLWDDVRRGLHSFAAGYNTEASGETSVAIGETNVASGESAVALGEDNTASGEAAIAMGDDNLATKVLSTAIGGGNIASADFATAIGITNEATDTAATAIGAGSWATAVAASAFGDSNEANGISSTAVGSYAIANGLGSFAVGNGVTSDAQFSGTFGVNVTASADFSQAYGNFNTAYSAYENVFGVFNTAYSPSSTTGLVPTDRLFVVGNGTNPGNKSDALIILKNGSTTINGPLTLGVSGQPLIGYTFPNIDGNAGQVLATDGSGILDWTDKTADTDNQTIDVLNLDGSSLEISLADDAEATKTLDLSGIDTDTDNQTIDVLNLNGSSLEISLADDAEVTKVLDLSSIDTDTDNQTIDVLNFNGSNLEISLADDAEATKTLDLSSLAPVGVIQMWPTSTPPTGWLICDGTTFDAATYSALNTLLGGNTLPDFSGRFPIAVGNSGATGATNHTLNSTGGEEKHTLTEAEMPKHKHGAGTLKTAFPYKSSTNTGNGQSNRDGSDVAFYDSDSITGDTGEKGNDTPHNNMPPFLTVNFIIKAK